jgi:hypothetical protein
VNFAVEFKGRRLVEVGVGEEPLCGKGVCGRIEGRLNEDARIEYDVP